MIKKKKKIWIISAITLTIICVASFATYKICNTQISKSVTSKNDYTVAINGAVKNPGSYTFNRPKSLREIIFSASVLTNADTTSLELEKIIDEDCQIIVPYKVGSVKKIKWKDLNSVEQLTDLGVKKSIAQTIINFRRQNESTTWEEILSLKGIGQVTLGQLKDIIDLS